MIKSAYDIPNKDTAVLIFSRTAKEEAAVKTFHPALGRKGNAAIAKRLIRHTLKIIRQTKLPYCASFSDEQMGNNFGEKLANALEDTFRKGFDKVIIIGNDTPNLSAKLLQRVQQQLSSESLVVGPANDGGVYLLGLTADAYQRKAFIELAWSSKKLQASWQTYAEAFAFDIQWLSVLQDIDHYQDLKTFLSQSKNYSILKSQFQAIIASIKRNIEIHIQQIFSVDCHQYRSLRAPPFRFPF